MSLLSLSAGSALRSAINLAGLTLAIYFSYYALDWCIRRRRMPPGPISFPLIGNRHELPPTEHWLKFTAWGKKYGAFWLDFVQYYPHLRWRWHSDMLISQDLFSQCFLDACQWLVSRLSLHYASLLNNHYIIMHYSAIHELAGILWKSAPIYFPAGLGLLSRKLSCIPQLFPSPHAIGNRNEIFSEGRRGFMMPSGEPWRKYRKVMLSNSWLSIAA